MCLLLKEENLIKEVKILMIWTFENDNSDFC
jgi:hypothetical protein